MIQDIVYGLLLVAGAGFLVAALVGFLRFPSSLARLHAVGVAGSAGFVLIVMARIAHAGSIWATVEYLIILFLGVVASATVSQAVAWAAHKHPRDDRTKWKPAGPGGPGKGRSDR